jgi:transglutaminase-like putative cysteine protease
MARLTILHETQYSYEHPVRFGQHRLMLRPRDTHALRVVEAGLTVSPPGDSRWVYDALGNSVCLFTPHGEARALSVVNRLVIERYPAPLDPIRPDNPQTLSPIVYARDDRVSLAPFIEPCTDDEGAVLLTWLREQVGRMDERALPFLLRINQAIHDQFTYAERDDEGVQPPALTVQRRSGACRDLAWLMVEALRRLGYAARFVSGYLHDPSGGMRGAGATHAWCEVFLPDLGWTEFDPTNALAESPDLIPIAATRTPREAAPISGTILGDPGHRQMIVRVSVMACENRPQAA